MTVTELQKPATTEQIKAIPLEALRAEVTRRMMNGAYGHAGSHKDFAFGPNEYERFDANAVRAASSIWKGGNRREALHQLENATADFFPGLGDLKLQDHP